MTGAPPPTSTPPPRCWPRCARTGPWSTPAEARDAAGRRWPGRRCTRSTRSPRRPRCGTAARPGCRSPDPGTPGRGVLGHRVRRRDRAAHRGRQGLPRRGRRAPLPPAPGLVPGGQGDLPAWRARRIARATMVLSPRPPRTWTATSPTWRTRSAPPRSTGSSRRRSGGSCPRRPNAAAGRPPTAAPSPSTPGSPRCRAPAPCTGSSTSPTPSTSTPPSPPAPQALKDLGSTDTLDVRRATAVGDLARRQLTLDLNPTRRRGPDGGQRRDRGRRPDAGRADRDPDSRHEEDPQAASGGALRAPLRRRRRPRRPAGRRVRPGREHQGSGARRADPAVVRQPRRRGHREAGARPERAHRRRGLRDPRPARGNRPS